MKNKYTYLFLSLLAALTVRSQISITSSDIVSAGDIIRVSTGGIVQNNDYQQSGASVTWDYSALEPVAQRSDTFLNIINTSLTYYGYFNLPAHKSNMAVSGPDIPAGSMSPVDINNTYAFFNKTSSRFEQTGFGASINELPTPVGFNKNDIIYRLPLQYDNRDTSESDYDVDVPSVGYLGHQQIRYNHVDAWGTLTTPFGTFQTLRVVSEVTGSDSVYSSTYGFGYRMPESTYREYKWMGAGYKLPLLQINTEVNGSLETISAVYYQDSVRNFPNSIKETSSGDFDFSVYPNPASQAFQISLPSEIAQANLTVSDLTGRVVFQNFLSTNREWINAQGMESGIYLISIQSEGLRSVRKLVVR